MDTVLGVSIASLNIIIITVTLIYIARQSRDTSRTLEEIRKNNRFQAMINVKSHMSEINKILIDNKKLADSFGYDIRDVLAYLIISDFEKLYLQHKEGLTDNEYWKAHENLIYNTINREFVTNAWLKHPTNNNELHPEFVQYIDSIVKNKQSKKQQEVKVNN